ncbi:hypothetical protein FACS1894152_8370 [Bacilli bacterium]|nr:hypothetical protein FACS1894152_8370 [Bacilli bacterium]
MKVSTDVLPTRFYHYAGYDYSFYDTALEAGKSVKTGSIGFHKSVDTKTI